MSIVGIISRGKLRCRHTFKAVLTYLIEKKDARQFLVCRYNSGDDFWDGLDILKELRAEHKVKLTCYSASAVYEGGLFDEYEYPKADYEIFGRADFERMVISRCDIVVISQGEVRAFDGAKYADYLEKLTYVL